MWSTVQFILPCSRKNLLCDTEGFVFSQLLLVKFETLSSWVQTYQKTFLCGRHFIFSLRHYTFHQIRAVHRQMYWKYGRIYIVLLIR